MAVLQHFVFKKELHHEYHNVWNLPIVSVITKLHISGCCEPCCSVHYNKIPFPEVCVCWKILYNFQFCWIIYYFILTNLIRVWVLAVILGACSRFCSSCIWSLSDDCWQEQSVSSKMPWCCCRRKKSPPSRASSLPLSWPTLHVSLCWSSLRTWMGRLSVLWCSTGEKEIFIAACCWS